MADPWRDAAQGGGWVTSDIGVGGLPELLDLAGLRSRWIVEQHDLTETAAVGGRFTLDGSATPQLQWILLHLIQEYARHTGHLDIARELVDGKTVEIG